VKGRKPLRSGEGGGLPDRCCAPQIGLTPLHIAANKGHAAVVEKLLTAEADKEATDKVSGEGG
jgi:hypothetical protein